MVQIVIEISKDAPVACTDLGGEREQEQVGVVSIEVESLSESCEATLRLISQRRTALHSLLQPVGNILRALNLAMSLQQGVDLIIGTTLGAVALAFCVGSLLECSERASACVAKVPLPLVLVARACYIIVDAWHPLKY